ncbi:MAG: DUF1679 domain-containing protein [Deltaproteobacteria bacterium]|nr:DUF1679 domain-containing protein [Deltaproteobacteria bacterium]MBT6435745.1 DUF1679 domain-containing protein [Deltaproteobacteria bacterium]
MQASVHDRIIRLTQARAITDIELIQPLWNNYGTLSRVYLQAGNYPSVIVKHIQIPEEAGHPKGFTGDISKERKIRSYQVETHWYLHQNNNLTGHAATPKCLDAFDDGHELFILLEDLGTRGFVDALYSTSWDEITVVLHWLADFHARLMGTSAEGLWPTGTYWHLATRPEELSNIAGSRLHRFASLIDARLRCSLFQTLVHGDAKLANFLFSADHTQVAGVDFQYVGRGCAMKDVAYFIGSCLSGSDCERQESKVLDIYFTRLRSRLPAHLDAEALEAEWRALYPLAWADFERFMTGWSPQHRKLTPYSDATTERALDHVAEELLSAARSACLAAGKFIQENKDQPLEVASKGFASRAADVVTQIDIKAQAMILDILKPTFERYDLGLLAEEGEQDDSRLQKHAFWTIDPLDGTQYFIDGQDGYATSIALVARDGKTILGVVYDPANDDLYEAIAGRGVKLNAKPLQPTIPKEKAATTTWFADLSLRNHPSFENFNAHFDIRFAGGAVMNTLQLLKHWKSCYCRTPKKELGGCAIWDLAAVSLMVEEQLGNALFFDGEPLNLNRTESVFFNDSGLAFSSQGVDIHALLNQVKSLIV